MSNTRKTEEILLRFMLLLYFIFICYASLSYGTKTTIENETALFGLFLLPTIRGLTSYHGIQDIIINILFYVPFGILVSGSVATRRFRYSTPWCLVGAAVSFSLEFIQHFIGRYASITDIVTNTLGFVAGFWLVVFAGKRYGLRPLGLIGLDFSSQQNKLLSAIRFIYVVLFCAISLYPFDVSFDPGKLYAQFSAEHALGQRIILDPLFHLKKGDWISPSWVLTFLSYVPIGLLSGLIGKRQLTSLFEILTTCLLLSVTVEFLQFFVQSQVSDVYNLYLSLFAGGFGWLLSTAIKRLRIRNFAKDTDQVPRTGFRLSLLLYFLFLCSVAWAPYKFELQATRVAEKIKTESNWIPFKNHLVYHSLGNAMDLVKEAGIFLPFGALLLLATRQHRSFRRNLIITGGIVFGVSFLLEISQGACQGRYVDITDSIMATLGGLVGATIVKMVRAPTRDQEPVPPTTRQQ